jgi:AcrR family transcriptional regulator
MSNPGLHSDAYRDRVIDAALRLAVARPWNEISLLEIAQAAGSNLVELRGHFNSKADIIAAFTRRIDDEVLAKSPPEPGQSRRDALFEVLMSRFDVMKPHKEAIRSIVGGARFDPALFKSALASQAWMLQAAGINTDGPGGAVRVAGLASVYAATLRTWLNDDDPGLARTMAALDRRLRRGERSLEGLEDVGAFARRVGGIFRRSSHRGDRSAGSSGQYSPGTSSETPPSTPSSQPGTP